MAHFRTIWISDLHLGARGCRAKELLEFLADHTSDTLYLVGDVVDFWALARRPCFPQPHRDVVQAILQRAEQGTNVFYLPGNHDDVVRSLMPATQGRIKILDKVLHTTADGREILVLHGDQFDSVIAKARWLAWIGDVGYATLQRCNHALNRVRSAFGHPYWSLSAYVKHRVKRAVQFMGDYQQQVIAAARAHDATGVVCGHIHHAELWERGGIVYANTGDWVESMSALVEESDGTMRLIRHAGVCFP